VHVTRAGAPGSNVHSQVDTRAVQLKDDRLLLSPSDVTAYLGCKHLTTLSLQVARGEIVKPPRDNEQAELVFRKGREHEAAYLAGLRADGKSVTEISLEPDFDWERAARETAEAIQSGADVVYQGVLMDDRCRGQADFLERQEDGTYEAVDTKLARHAKPACILFGVRYSYFTFVRRKCLEARSNGARALR
jgi:predicted RecB family nuclease